MNDLYVTKRTKFHWKDLKHVINFVDNVDGDSTTYERWILDGIN